MITSDDGRERSVVFVLVLSALSSQLNQSASSKVNGMMGLVEPLLVLPDVWYVLALCKSPKTYNKRQLSHSLFFPFSSAMGSGVSLGSRG
jgi:hypothetical protein